MIKRSCECGIKMDLEEMGWQGENWFYLTCNRDKWRALVHMVMNRYKHIQTAVT